MFVNFDKLQEADLIVDTVYRSGNNGNLSDEVLSKLMMCENSGGFRKKGSLKSTKLNYIVLYSTGKHDDWKDRLNKITGEFTYYGDQYMVNKEIHDTAKKGNEVLRRTFYDLKKDNRKNIAPFFIFINDENRNVKFIGLAAPGSCNKNINECLEVVTINTAEGQIKNYKAIFTMLDDEIINRKWLIDLNSGIELESEYVPQNWKLWVEKGKYNSIVAKEIETEIKDYNINQSSSEKDLLENIDINELNSLVKNIENLKFDIKYKPIDTKIADSSGNKTDINYKKKSISPKKNKNYIKEYIKKQIIGLIGEYIILSNEKEILRNSGNKELIDTVNDIEWSSKESGDGLGYDIKSFGIREGKIIDKYIEVKTTVGQDKDFEITINEVEKSNYLNENGLYVIARVYNLDIKNRTAEYYFKEGKIESNYVLKASEYIAHRK